MKKKKAHPDAHTIRRLIKMVTKEHKLGVFLCLFFVCTMSVSNVASSFFVKPIIDAIVHHLLIHSSFEVFWSEVAKYLIILGSIYIEGIISAIMCNCSMAIVTQRFLNDLRKRIFSNMETLPIRYFDTHKRGDIMSIYTNDIDTIRQITRESLPGVFQTFTIVGGVVGVMVYYSLWLTFVVVAAAIAILFTAKHFGKVGTKFFRKKQEKLGIVEGHVEEAINGLKVIKVFSHEEESAKDFEKLSNELTKVSIRGHGAGNSIAPVVATIGNFLYVFLGIFGGLFIILNVKNVSIGAIVDPSKYEYITAGTIAAFLVMARVFTNNVNNLSQQLAYISLGRAGAARAFALFDEKSEDDNGYVTLVNVKYREDGSFYETNENTRFFAWKHPHGDGTLTYTPLKGDILLEKVDFAYNPPHLVLKDVSIFARPSEQIALVGATGAGKTTITNLLNRFYDIEDGKIRYDGININKIKKESLRRSLGVVLQDTNLFTGTVMENIRYGNLNATDEEVKEAAKIANAYDFICRLPKGFNTMLSGDGSNLSQGQRQLLNIARAAVANVPVMVLDEATSSIDTRTELLVQKGMDKLMEGRTTFVIAHRLSTVKNSDAIIVLDHGKIIERGNHDELIKQKGVYYQLYTGAFELE